MDEKQERKLIAAFQAGDTDAFTDLFDAYRRRVLSLSLQIVRNEEIALDVAQEVFLRACEELHRWRGEARLGTWLYRAVINVSMERLRAEEKQKRLAGINIPKKTGTSPDKAVVNKELFSAVEQAIADLPPRQRTVFVMKQFNDLRFIEIAALMALTEGGVKANYHKALISLRDKLRMWAPASYKEELNHEEKIEEVVKTSKATLKRNFAEEIDKQFNGEREEIFSSSRPANSEK